MQAVPLRLFRCLNICTQLNNLLNPNLLYFFSRRWLQRQSCFIPRRVYCKYMILKAALITRTWSHKAVSVLNEPDFIVWIKFKSSLRHCISQGEMTVERIVVAEDQIKERRKSRNLRNVVFLVLVKKA